MDYTKTDLTPEQIKMDKAIKKLMKVTIKNNKIMKKEMIIGSAIMICEKYLPFMNVPNKRQLVVFTLMDNLDYCNDLVSYYNGNIKDDRTISNFMVDLSHDLMGLRQQDPHFLPRISN